MEPGRRRQRIHLYATLWNEVRMLGFFFRHYDRFVDRYVLYDDGSTDGTLEMLARHPRVEVRHFERAHPNSLVLSTQELHRHDWKESRGSADWVIVGDIDEHLWHPAFEDYLARVRTLGVTAIPALGFDMTCGEVPSGDETLFETRRRGAPSVMCSKLNLFDPNAIEETNYSVGHHRAAPEGMVRFPERDELLLLHYKYIAIDYIEPRHAFLAARRGAVDRANGWGRHYDLDRAALLAKIAELDAKAVDIRDRAAVEAASTGPRWWRPLSAFRRPRHI